MTQQVMQKFLSISIVLLMFIPLSSAQVYSSGCHPDFRDQIGKTASEVDFDSMCDVYIECLSTDSRDCILSAFEVAFLPCNGVDACENEAILYSATIDLFNHPNLVYGLSFDTLPIEEVVDALEYISAGEYEDALGSYNSIPYDYGHPMIPLNKGYIYTLMGDTENAIEQYNIASQSINDPIIYFARAREYARSDMNQALIDINIFYDLVSQANVPDLQDMLTPMISELTLDSAYEREDWLWYPIQVATDGPGGLDIVDISDESPTEISLYQIDDDTLLLDNVPLPQTYHLVPTIIRLSLDSNNQYKMRGFFFQQHGESSQTLTLQFDDRNHYEGKLVLVGFESLKETRFILAPADQPDPR